MSLSLSFLLIHILPLCPFLFFVHVPIFFLLNLCLMPRTAHFSGNVKSVPLTIPHILPYLTEPHPEEWDYRLCHSGASLLWRILSILGPALLNIFNRHVYEDMDGRITKYEDDSKPGSITKLISDRINFHNDLSWLECWYETNELKFKSGRCKVQHVKFRESADTLVLT